MNGTNELYRFSAVPIIQFYWNIFNLFYIISIYLLYNFYYIILRFIYR